MPTINFGTPKAREYTVNKQNYQFIYQDKRWKLLRKRKLQENPICEKCEKKGIVIAAEEVHHKIPFYSAKDPDEMIRLAFPEDLSDLESLCITCHKLVDKVFRKMKR